MFINSSLVVLSNFAAPVLSNCFFRAADFVFCGNVCLCLFFSRGCFVYFEKGRVSFCIFAAISFLWRNFAAGAASIFRVFFVLLTEMIQVTEVSGTEPS